mgnify:CR=1 FL=1
MMKGSLWLASIIAIVLAGAVFIGSDSLLKMQEEPKPIVILSPFNPTDTKLYQRQLDLYSRREGQPIQLIGAGGNFADLVRGQLPMEIPADLAIFPQPGVYSELARQGKLTPFSQQQVSELKRTFPPDLVNLSTVEGKVYGIWIRFALKSLIWYRADIFRQLGYSIPTTLSELRQLEEQIIADGMVPWCIAVDDKGARGWPATDWVEEYLIRHSREGLYDDWINHRVPFSNPQIVAALADFQQLATDSKRTYGGAETVLSTPIVDGVFGLFDTPPVCLMHRQEDWIRASFPEGTQFGINGQINVMLYPSVSATDLRVLSAGDILGALNDRPEVIKLMLYMGSEEFGRRMASSGSHFSAHLKVKGDAYPDEISRRIAGYWRLARVIRFDASDMMPPEVGTGAFWDGMIDLLEGMPPEQVARNIDAAWPEQQPTTSPAK